MRWASRLRTSAWRGQVQYAQWFDVRGDWNINKKNQLFVRYNYFRNRYPFNTAVGGLNALSAAADFQDRAHIIGAQLVTTFTPTLLNEFRGSWPYRNEHHVADPLTGPGPQVVITGVATFGGSSGVADKFQEKIPSFSDNVTWIKGKHSMKYGMGFQTESGYAVGRRLYVSIPSLRISAYANAKNGVILTASTRRRSIRVLRRASGSRAQPITRSSGASLGKIPGS